MKIMSKRARLHAKASNAGCRIVLVADSLVSNFILHLYCKTASSTYLNDIKTPTRKI